jgi:methyl-accepting chemotaxis protein
MFVFAANKERATKYSQDWDKSSKDTLTRIEGLIANRSKYFSDAEVSKARDWETAMKRYVAGFDGVRQQVLAGTLDGVAANAANGVNVDFVRPFGREAPAAAAARVKAAQEAVAAAKATSDKVRNGIFALLLVVMLYLIYLAVSLPKKVTQPLAKISDAVERMSKGDLNTSLEAVEVEEFAKLQASTERMRKAFAMMMERIKRG